MLYHLCHSTRYRYIHNSVIEEANNRYRAVSLLYLANFPFLIQEYYVNSLHPLMRICPRDNVTFTCVVDSVVTQWTVGPGDDDLCVYLSVNPTTDTCGPDGRFESSQTDIDGPASNSSLSVDLIINDLNGTTVFCSDGTPNGQLIGSYNICIIGKSIYMENQVPHSLAYNVHNLASITQPI